MSENKPIRTCFLDDIRTHFGVARPVLYKNLGWSRQRYSEHVRKCSSFDPKKYPLLIKALGVSEDQFYAFHKVYFSA